MSGLNLFLQFFLILTAVFIFQASALQKEGILTSNISPPETFTYQVGIIGRVNYSEHPFLICDGGIIGPNLAISAGSCFITELGDHRNFTYSVSSDYTNENILKGFEILIDEIHFFRKGPYLNYNLAVTTLVQAFDFIRYGYLRELELPHFHEVFWEQQGIVAGHGFHLYRAYFNERGDGVKEINSFTDYRLRNATVQITTNSDCILSLDEVDYSLEFCGLMYPENPGERTGVCHLDTGAPLVIGNKTVGVAGVPTFGCGESTPYAKVSAYWYFINAIKKGRPLRGSIIFKNRILLQFPNASLNYNSYLNWQNPNTHYQ